jgi:MarR-like DNA-binding transcriptional regulator SgrR of sgrS sRNA
MRRTAAPRLALVLALLALPAVAPSALGPRYGGTLRVGVIELPPLDPLAPRSADERMFAGLAHATLVSAGPDGQPLPELAAGWSSAASGREWTLRLREATFHDGTPLTAEDAARSLRRFLRAPSPAAAHMAQALSGGAAFRQGATEKLAGVEARGPRTLLLRFDAPRPLALAPLASPAAAVTSAAGTGAGPFAPSAVVASRRASFAAAAMHVRGRPYVDRVELSVLPEAALGSELQAGRVDLVLSGGGGPLAGVLLLLLDSTRPPFDRAPVRAAVAGAVDRPNLVRHLLPGGEAGSTLLPPVLLPPLGSEPPRAAANAPRSAATLAVSREVPSMVSQRVVAHLSDLGLQVAAEPRAPSRVLGGPPAALRLWIWSPEVPEPGLALQELAGLLPPQPAVSEALAAAAAEMDLDRRRAHLYRAEAALRATGLLVPLAAVPVSYRAAVRLQDVHVNAAGRVSLEDAWWEP